MLDGLDENRSFYYCPESRQGFIRFSSRHPLLGPQKQEPTATLSRPVATLALTKNDTESALPSYGRYSRLREESLSLTLVSRTRHYGRWHDSFLISRLLFIQQVRTWDMEAMQLPGSGTKHRVRRRGQHLCSPTNRSGYSMIILTLLISNNRSPTVRSMSALPFNRNSRYFTSEVILPALDAIDTSSARQRNLDPIPALYTNDPRAVSRWLEDNVSPTGGVLGFDVEVRSKGMPLYCASYMCAVTSMRRF